VPVVYKQSPGQVTWLAAGHIVRARCVLDRPVIGRYCRSLTDTPIVAMTSAVAGHDVG